MTFIKEKKHIFFLLLSLGFVLTFNFSLSKKVFANCGCSSGYYCPSMRTVQYKDGCTASCGQNYSTGVQSCCDGVNCMTTSGLSVKICVRTGWGCYEEAGSSRYGEPCCEKSACTPYSGCYCGSLATSNQGYGSTSVYCSDGCGGTTSSTCYCYACSIPSCPSGTSTSGDYGFKTTRSCTNSCGNSRSQNCYCTTQCELPSCSPDYYSSDQGTGSVVFNCTNECGNVNSRTCYCPTASCSDYSDGSGVVWSDSVGDRSAQLTIPISPTPPSGCDATTTKTCYTSNTKPQFTGAQMVPAAQVQSLAPYSDNLFSKIVNRISAQSTFEDQVIMGYSSSTHSGINELGLNNPVGIQATFTDSNGAGDIEALYIWFDDEASSIKTFNVPNKLLDQTAKTENTHSWGFMVTTDGNFYAPSMDSQDTWTNLGSISGATFNIISPDGGGEDKMVEVSQISINSSGNDIQLNAQLKFLNTSPSDTLDISKYQIWGMASDHVGFTTFTENDEIKDNDLWAYEDNDWNIDLEIPTFSILPQISADTEGEVNLSFVAEDDELAYVRVDACQSDMVGTIDPLSTVENSSYSLLSCDAVGSYENINIDDEDLLYGNPALLSTGTVSVDPLVINIGDNDSGSITFTVTAMDKGGNINQENVTYKLGDWAIVENGMVYGGTGVSSSTRNLEDNAWDTSTFPMSTYGFTADLADLTDQVLLGGNTNVSSFLGILEKYRSDENNSFKAANFSGFNITNPYIELMDIYKTKKLNSSYTFVEVNDTSDLSNSSLTDICGADFDFCIISYKEGSIDMSNFTCDDKGLIAASGDINVTPDLENNTEQDACIILSAGDININPGTDATGDPVGYDLIQAYMIASGSINISLDSNENGLLVEGGIAGFTPVNGQAIVNNRSIAVSPRTTYPVIMVNNNAKYGLLSRLLFGSQVDIFQTEIGFKPY